MHDETGGQFCCGKWARASCWDAPKCARLHSACLSSLCEAHSEDKWWACFRCTFTLFLLNFSLLYRGIASGGSPINFSINPVPSFNSSDLFQTQWPMSCTWAWAKPNEPISFRHWVHSDWSFHSQSQSLKKNDRRWVTTENNYSPKSPLHIYDRLWVTKTQKSKNQGPNIVFMSWVDQKLEEFFTSSQIIDKSQMYKFVQNTYLGHIGDLRSARCTGTHRVTSVFHC